MTVAPPTVSALLAAQADGIGEVPFASAAWVKEAGEVLREAADRHRDGLRDVAPFTICEVTHNAPAWLHAGSKLAWHARFNGGRFEVASGELPTAECTFKVAGDHSLISNACRILYQGRDPRIVALAQARIGKLGRFDRHGSLPAHPVLGAVLRTLHDRMAVRTLPRFVFMTPEWVHNARQILTSRATSAEFADGIRNVVYTFSEEFTETPKYAFPDGSHGGFWVHVNHGQITVGAGPLPAALGPADALTKGAYTPVVPIGRTVNAAMTQEEKDAQTEYSKRAFRFDKVAGKRPVEQTQPSGRGPMPPELGRIFSVLHDELSKRTAGDLPSDYDSSIRPEWASPPQFDRLADYDKSWLNYDKVDVYGEPRSA